MVPFILVWEPTETNKWQPRVISAAEEVTVSLPRESGGFTEEVMTVVQEE